MAGSYYNKRIPNQLSTVMNGSFIGMNEYTPANRIKDVFMSQSLDAYRYRNEAMYLFKRTANAMLNASYTGAGHVYAGIADTYPSDSSSITFNKHLFLVVGNNAIGADAYIDSLIDMDIKLATKTVVDMSSYNLYKTGVQSMCTFYTEAFRYVCYTNSKSKKLFYYNYSELKYVDLPFYPRAITSHANRIFAADVYNKIWWSRAGDITSWYSMEQDDDYFYTGNMINSGTYTIISGHTTPPSARPVMFTVTAQDTAEEGDTLGSIIVAGLDWQDKVSTETVTLSQGITYSTRSFKSITTLTEAGHASVDTVDTIKIGYGAVGNGYVQADAGYWTLEREREIKNIAVINNNLYIFTDIAVYVFRGYSYDTFSLDMIITDLGSYNQIAISNNLLYFQYNSIIYEYDGDNYPRVISRPIERNGQSVNGMFGGINHNSTTTYGMVADSSELIVYMPNVTSAINATPLQAYYYKYNIRTAVWTYHSGFYGLTTSTSGDYVSSLYLADSDRSGFYNICTTRNSTDEAVWKVYAYTGHNPTENPYLITKCYDVSPSTDGTLTELILELKANLDDMQADVTVYYSLTLDGDDFEVMWTNENYTFSGDIEHISIKVPQDMISRAHHYRLKIEFEPVSTSQYVYIYNIERRYRLIGRSR